MRNIRRKNEQVFWAPIPKAYTLTRVSMAGAIVGLQSLSHGLDLKLKPYVVSGVRDTKTSPALQTTTFLRDVGIDAKYGVTGGLNLDLTYNTDFAQVEVDEQQVNLTRFSLFFPEKRDFFLENAGFFKMGTGGTFTSTTVETDLFFSRRIGLSDTGQPIPIVGGGRLAGKSGRHNIGVLDIQTDSAFGRPGDNFLVTRYSSDVLKRSRVGAMFINKQTMGGDAHYNRTFGADANLVLGKNLQVNSYVAKTDTPGLQGNDMAFFGRVAYRDPAWNVWLNYLDVQDNFNDEVGFVQRRGVKTTKAYFSPTPRPGVGHPHAGADGGAQLRHRSAEPPGDAHAALHERLLPAGRLVHQRDLPAESRRARRAVQDPVERDDSGRHLQRSTSSISPTTPTRRSGSTSASRGSRWSSTAARVRRSPARWACARPATSRAS